ncbi:MAG: hypothetical protein NTW28_20005 [Candidatus Solibacter sp.]|nr:hypothetical protein [Candidatus Solibacter sp.]
MGTAALVEQLKSARQQLDFACDLLIRPSPEALDSCSSVLEAAGHQLAEWQPTVTLQAGNAAALEEAWRLRRSFVRTARLLQGAGDFHLNWLQIRGAMTGGYTETGESAPLIHGNRISLHG